MGGDWKAVAFWSALALVILAPLVYTPTMFVLRTVLKDSRRTMWFSTVGALLAPIPNRHHRFRVGRKLARGLISEEAIPFHVMFAVFRRDLRNRVCVAVQRIGRSLCRNDWRNIAILHSLSGLSS